MVSLWILSNGEARQLIDQLEVANSWWARFRGLMLRRELAPGIALRIEPCGSIHMMFMRFPIDAVFYDADHRVTRVARGLRPWIGIATGGRGARGVIEMPVGAADGIEPGMLLEFRESSTAQPEAA